MPRWFKRFLLHALIWRINGRISDMEEELDVVQLERWLALEEMDAPAYDRAAIRSLSSKRELRHLKSRREQLAQQLERL